MKYAIIKLLNKQYIIQQNYWYNIPYLKNFKMNNIILLNKILLININNNIQIGYPYIKNCYIIAKIINQKIKDNKIIILKTKPKKNYTRVKGYSSFYTQIKINSIKY